MDDPYTTLGIERTADEAAIRKAYRSLAKRYHPDLNPGDAAAAERFRTIAAAYDILGDAEKRRRFDAGEIDASGAEAPRHFWRDFAERPEAERYRAAGGFDDYADLSDLFGDVFARDEARPGGGRPRRGRDVGYQMAIDFLEAVNGASRRVTMPDGKVLDVRIPAGLSDGQVLRLKGEGTPGRAGGPPGDALVEVSVRPHPVFARSGEDIHVELPVTIDEAALGADVEVPTITGRVRLKVPAGADTGRQLRLRGKGVARPGAPPGDQIVRLSVRMPPVIDEELAGFLSGWRERHGYDPRGGGRREDPDDGRA